MKYPYYCLDKTLSFRGARGLVTFFGLKKRRRREGGWEQPARAQLSDDREGSRGQGTEKYQTIKIGGNTYFDREPPSPSESEAHF